MVRSVHARRGLTLAELLVAVLVLSIVLLAISRFFINYISTSRETQMRLRLQRDAQNLSYWLRKDLSALAVRNQNFDLKNGAFDFAFLGADDPSDTVDWTVNTTDADLDRFTWVFSANKATRTHDRLGTLGVRTSEISFESIEPQKGDTFSVEIRLRDIFDTPVIRSQFDATLGNFDYPEPIRKVEIDLIFSKRVPALFGSSRPPIVEKSRIQTVAFYRRSG
jgi:prepilin-type N-terminal cleavage/methylation domain-containing protein